MESSSDEDCRAFTCQDQVKSKVTRLRDRGRQRFNEFRLKRKQPIYIRLIDRYTFTMGVVTAAATEYILLKYPLNFWMFFVALFPVLYLSKLMYYIRQKWQWFLIDFCYFTNVSCILHVLLAPNNDAWLKINFFAATGPVAWAIPLWKNSLVFHDIDKVSSIYVHVMPMLLLYTLRWQKTEFVAPMSFGDFSAALFFYGTWQLLYLLTTEWMFGSKLNADPQLLTSLRWLATDEKNGMNQLVLWVCRRIGAMGKTEKYNPQKWKTKLIFVFAQFLYTLVTWAPIPLFFFSQTSHLGFIAFCLLKGVHNGAEYYIEVFSRRYIQQVEEKASKAASVVPIDKSSKHCTQTNSAVQTPRSKTTQSSSKTK